MTVIGAFSPHCPNSIKLPSAGDSIAEGDERECFAGENGSPAEFYVTPTDGFPENFNRFTREMTDNYQTWTSLSRHFKLHFPKLKPEANEIQPGSIVACINRTHRPLQENEIVRAKVIRQVENLPENKEGNAYQVLMVDIGAYDTVNLKDMYFLHGGFIPFNCCGIKSRFILDRHCSPYDMGGEKGWKKWMWPRPTLNFMNEVIAINGIGRRLKVRFVRRVKEEVPNVGSEDIWEVSILSVTPVHEEIDESRSVDEQIIEHTIGTYGYFRLVGCTVDIDKG